jgi:hypothetical protein
MPPDDDSSLFSTTGSVFSPLFDLLEVYSTVDSTFSALVYSLLFLPTFSFDTDLFILDETIANLLGVAIKVLKLFVFLKGLISCIKDLKKLLVASPFTA